jgi:hypothetical protein
MAGRVRRKLNIEALNALSAGVASMRKGGMAKTEM